MRKQTPTAELKAGLHRLPVPFQHLRDVMQARDRTAPFTDSARTLRMVVVTYVPILVVLLVVVVGAIAVSLATPSKGSRILMWGLLGTLFAVLGVGAAVLLLKPNAAVLSVTGAAGKGFTGKVTVDGVEQRIDGVIPAEFEFVGRRIEYVVIASELDTSRYVGVECEGRGSRSAHGAQGTLLTMPGGFQHASHPVSESEWQQLIEVLGDPQEQSSDLSEEGPSPAAP